jgi:hypothetical protein
MKAILALAVLVMAGSAFGASGVNVDDFVNEAMANSRRLHDDIRSNATDFVSSQPSIEASKPMKVDYTIVTLPDGKTASALTFK